jgi:hypothetical protein
MLLRQALRVKGFARRPTVAVADVPDCFASIAASRFTVFWRRSHAFVSPWPPVVKRLQASSQAGRHGPRQAFAN